MRALEQFCTHTKLSVNSSKSEIMLMKRQNKDNSCIMYNDEHHLKIWKALHTLALKFPPM